MVVAPEKHPAKGSTIRRLVALVCLFSVVSCSNEVDSLVSLGTLEVNRIELVADSSEPILEVLVSEGDLVQTGDELMRQDPVRAEVALKAAVAAAAVARAQLDQSLAGPRGEEIDAVKAQLAAAESEMRTIELELEREQSLVKQDFSSQNRLDIFRGRFETAVALRDQVTAVLDELNAGTRIEVIDAARHRLVGAQAQVEQIQITLNRTVTRAPVEGIIEGVLFESGERPQPGRVTIIIAENSRPYARVYVQENLRTRLAAGARAEVRLDGIADSYPGVLRWIAHDASYTPYFALTQKDRVHLSYLAEVELDPTMKNVPTGVPVEVRFLDLK